MNVNTSKFPKIMYDQTQFIGPYLIGKNGIYLDEEIYNAMKAISGYAPNPWYLYTQYTPEAFFFGAYSEETMQKESEVGYCNFTDPVFVEQLSKDAEIIYQNTKRLKNIYLEKLYKKERSVLESNPQTIVDFFYDIRDALHFAQPRYLLTQPQRSYKIEEEVQPLSERKDINVLLKNGRELTYISQIRKFILELAQEVATSRLSFHEYINKNPEWKEKARKMTDEVGFLNWLMFGGEIADFAYVEKEIGKLLSDTKSFESEKSEMDSRIQEIKERKNIMAENRSRKEYELADVSGYLPELRFNMNSCIIPCLSYIAWCVFAISEALGMTNESFQSLEFDEMVDLIRSGTHKVSENTLKERQKGYLVEFTDNGAAIFAGEDAHNRIKGLLEHRKEEIRTTTEVRGTVASFPDKKNPIIRARAVVFTGLEFSEEGVQKRTEIINSFPDGSILVTTQTHPDVVPIMKKAAAIVTDEGGLTCHAAIVSRELGKPCVIGTRLGSKIFKTGDMVEVNLDTCTVKKVTHDVRKIT